MTDYKEDWDIATKDGSLRFAGAIYSRLVGGEQDESELLWLAEYLRVNSTALAQPEQEVLARVEFGDTEFNCPSDVVLSQYCDDWFFGNPRDEVDPVDLCRGAIKLFAQMPTPIPVEERLPKPEECDAEDECYWFDPAGAGAWYLDTYQGNYTHWLPHHALPVPQP